MNSMMIGIPSYKPDDENLFKARLKFILKNFECVTSVISDPIEVYICTQRWNDDDFKYFDDLVSPLKNLKITYLKYDHGLGCDGAKNKILDVFYNSDYDFILMCDDDAYIIDHYRGVDLIKILYYNPEMINVDMIRFDLAMNPFKESVLNIRDVIEKNILLTFNGCPKWGGVHILKNLKKYYNIQPDDDVYYYYESYTIDGKEFEIHDDVFRRDIMKLRGFKVYGCKNVYFRFHLTGVRKNTFASSRDINLVKVYDRYTEEVIKRIAIRDKLIDCDENTTPSAMRHRISLKFKPNNPDILIPRPEPYTFTENELRINKRSRKKS